MTKKAPNKDVNSANQPLVSIITPVYNGEVFIGETIKTVCEQTYKNWEWIIVDDASSDETVKIVKNAIKKVGGKKIRLIESKNNRGAAESRNAGIKAANGEYLCFLDADDLWIPEKLEKQVNFMKEKNCAFSFTGYEFADASGKPNGKVVRVPATITYKQALRNTTIFTSTVMFDLRRLSREDILMPKIDYEDTATWWKVLKEVDSAYGLNEALSFYRRSSRTLSSNKFIAIKRVWNLYRNHEELNLLNSVKNFVGYAINAARRRV